MRLVRMTWSGGDWATAGDCFKNFVAGKSLGVRRLIQHGQLRVAPYPANCLANSRQVPQVDNVLGCGMFNGAVLGDECLGPAHQLNHVFVGFPGVVAEGEYTVMKENNAFVLVRGRYP